MITVLMKLIVVIMLPYFESNDSKQWLYILECNVDCIPV